MKALRKKDFMEKCRQLMGAYVTPITLNSTIRVLSEMRLSSYADDAVLDETVICACIDVLYERIKILKGTGVAIQFCNDFKKAG